MSKSALIAAVVVLPAVWGWLAETLLRRFWPRHLPPPPPTAAGAATAPVDFQI